MKYRGQVASRRRGRWFWATAAYATREEAAKALRGSVGGGRVRVVAVKEQPPLRRHFRRVETMTAELAADIIVTAITAGTCIGTLWFIRLMLRRND